MTIQDPAYMPRIALAEAARDALERVRDACQRRDDDEVHESALACKVYCDAYQNRYGKELTFGELEHLETLKARMVDSMTKEVA